MLGAAVTPAAPRPELRDQLAGVHQVGEDLELSDRRADVGRTAAGSSGAGSPTSRQIGEDLEVGDRESCIGLSLVFAVDIPSE